MAIRELDDFLLKIDEITGRDEIEFTQHIFRSLNSYIWN